MNFSAQFVLIAKRILRELKVLGEAVSAGFLGVQKQVETVTKQYQASKEGKTPGPEMVAVLDSLQGIHGEQRTENRSESRYQSRNFWVSVIGVLVLLGYTIINYHMLCQMRREADTAQGTFKKSIESFRTDERAWIEIENVKLEFVNPATAAFHYAGFTYEVYARNVGKTVARDITVKRWAALSANTGDILARDIEHGHEIPSIFPSLPMPKSLAPNTPIFIPFTIGGTAPQVYGEGDKRMTWYDYLVGRFDHKDAFGIAHWLKFCYVITDPNGNLGYCETGNDEDRNPEITP